MADLSDFYALDELLNDDEQMIRDTVKKFVESEFKPLVAEHFEAGTFPMELVPTIADMGLLGMHLDGYGCAGASAMAYGIACRELEAGDSGLRSFVSVQGSLCMFPIWKYGSEEQKEEWLPKMAAGEVIGCFGLTEPDHGSDPSSMATNAKRDGDEWILNGQKVWSSGAQFSEWGMAVCRTDSDLPKHKGITVFIIPMDAPGVEIRQIRQMSGGTSFNEVFLTDVRIPDTYRVGDIGEGWKVALTVLGFERGSSNGSSRVGGNWAQAKGLAEHLNLTEDPVIRDQLARLYSQYRIMVLNNQRVVAQTKAGQAPGPEGSISKMIWVKSMNLMSDVITKMLGPRITADTGEWGTYEWNEHLLGAPGYRIAGGSDEIQRNIVGERVLGLPGEPRVDKNIPYKDVLK